MAARPGARLATRLGMPLAKDTLLRLVRAAPEPDVGLVRVGFVREIGRQMFATFGATLLSPRAEMFVRTGTTRGS
jgi:hypothetical protein